ncbi:hypothetical protein MJL22_26485, partial [Salmonella enterica subsp. enterica serovar Montevideo]|nr:hypothetical protein [Salmonella enterica subsp. enterica serovar Montevideo]
DTDNLNPAVSEHHHLQRHDHSQPAIAEEAAVAPQVMNAGGLPELSSGKDTPSGHWEIAGVPVLFDWGYFSDHENSFPQELLDKL